MAEITVIGLSDAQVAVLALLKDLGREHFDATSRRVAYRAALNPNHARKILFELLDRQLVILNATPLVVRWRLSPEGWRVLDRLP